MTILRTRRPSSIWSRRRGGGGISSVEVTANGDGTVTLSYSSSGIEANKPPKIEKIVVTSTGDLTDIAESDVLTATITKSKRAPAQSWAASDTIIWYTGSDRKGASKTQVGTGVNYTVQNGDLGQKYIWPEAQSELNPATAGNPSSDLFVGTMVGPTQLDLPFGTVAPQTWIQFKDWDLDTHTAPNLGDLGGNAQVVATFSNPTTKNGNFLDIDCENNNELVQIPGENYNVDVDGTLTVFIKFKVQAADTPNAGIISFGATDYFQKRTSDWQLRANGNANFGSSDNNIHVAKIQLKTGTDQCVLDLDSAIGTNTTRATGNPSNGLYANLILGATNNSGSNPAGGIEVEEVIVYTKGKYNNDWDNDAKTYFGV